MGASQQPSRTTTFREDIVAGNNTSARVKLINTTKRPIRIPTGQLLGTKTDHERQKRKLKMLCDKPFQLEISQEDLAKCKKVKAFQSLIDNNEILER